MTLAPGSLLGHYELLHQIGVGGMGEVYRARDPRLKRDVALKVLPAAFAGDPARLHRFEVEAQAVGRLNHPNILHVYDVGQHEGQPFLVTEVLEGETLRERLDTGPLPVRKAVEIAIEIAHGLAAAHDHGIVHCDLKPGNLLMTRDGRLKILDFGLAKLTRPSDEDSTEASTASYDTNLGRIWGTVGYMSPEQIRGQAADGRSDIFSFGAILYEMLAGKRAFQGASDADTMSATLHEDPADLRASNKDVPSTLERIVRHCLEKAPDERFRSAHDLAFQLECIAEPTEAERSLRPATAPSPEAAAYRQITHRRGIVYSARFAPDGETVLYSAAWEDKPIEMFLKRPEAPDAIALAFPPAQVLAISPRGEVASLLSPKFVHNGVWMGTLASSPLLGGAPREIAEGIQHADFAPQGGGIAVTRDVEGKAQLEYPLGHVLYRCQGHLSFPRFSPAGDRIAFFEHPWPLDDRGSVAVVDLEGKKSTVSDEWATVQGLAWSPDGEEMFFAAAPVGTARALYAIKPSGELRSISGFPGAVRLLDISQDGKMLVCRDGMRAGIYAKAPGEEKERELSWLDWSLVADISQDGKMILFDEENEQAGPNYVACIRKTDGSPLVQLGEGAARLLSPDGRWALCRLPAPESPLTLYPTGPGEKREIHSGGRRLAPGREVRWMPDGRRILQFGRSEDGSPTAWLVDLKTLEWTRLSFEWPGLPSGVAVAPDGDHLLASYKSGATSIVSLREGSMKSGPVLEPDERVVTFDPDGEWIFTCASQRQVPCPTHRIQLTTGRREAWREIGPVDPVGVVSINLRITPDGEAYAYTYSRVLSELYLAGGLAG